VLVAAVSFLPDHPAVAWDEPDYFACPPMRWRFPVEFGAFTRPRGCWLSLMSWAWFSPCWRQPQWAGSNAAGNGSILVGLNALWAKGWEVMAWGFPRCFGVGYDTIEACCGTQSGCPLQLAGLAGSREAAGHGSAMHGFLSAVALLLRCSLGPVLGNLLWPVAGRERPALGGANHSDPYGMVGMARCAGRSARAPLTALLLLLSSPTTSDRLPLKAATGLSALLMDAWLGLAEP